MNGRDLLDQLSQHQEKITAIVARAEILIIAPGTPDIMAIGKARWEMLRQMREYQLFKHMMIFDPILTANASGAGLAREMKEECTALGDAFRAYMIEWSTVSVIDNIAAYRTAATASIARVRHHLKRERQRASMLLGV